MRAVERERGRQVKRELGKQEGVYKMGYYTAAFVGEDFTEVSWSPGGNDVYVSTFRQIGTQQCSGTKGIIM